MKKLAQSVKMTDCESHARIVEGFIFTLQVPPGEQAVP